MDWRQRRVLVTGATGIVGSWLVKRLLEEQSHVVALIRDWDPQSELMRSGDVARVSVVCGKLEEFRTLERAISAQEIDTVFHLGAQTIVGTGLRSPLSTFEANIRGTYNLLEACRVHSSLVERVVVASSDKAYGSTAVPPYTEEMPLNGRHPYDVSKSCTDLIALTYAHTYGLPISVARCANIYGGGDLNWSRIVPGTIRSLLHNERPLLRSNGTTVREYFYVRDAVEAYLMLAERTPEETVRGEAFNFGTQDRASALEITALLRGALNRMELEPIVLDQAKGEIKDQYLDSTKAKRVLDWMPRYCLEPALVETVQWYERFLGIGQ